MIRQELRIRGRLSHPNIVPFLEIAYGFGLQGNAPMVSLWMPHGTLHTFLEVYGDRLVMYIAFSWQVDFSNALLLPEFSLMYVSAAGHCERTRLLHASTLTSLIEDSALVPDGPR